MSPWQIARPPGRASRRASAANPGLVRQAVPGAVDHPAHLRLLVEQPRAVGVVHGDVQCGERSRQPVDLERVARHSVEHGRPVEALVEEAEASVDPGRAPEARRADAGAIDQRRNARLALADNLRDPRAQQLHRFVVATSEDLRGPPEPDGAAKIGDREGRLPVRLIHPCIVRRRSRSPADAVRRSSAAFSASDRRPRTRSPTSPRLPRRSGAPARHCRGRCPAVLAQVEDEPAPGVRPHHAVAFGTLERGAGRHLRSAPGRRVCLCRRAGLVGHRVRLVTAEARCAGSVCRHLSRW